MPWSARRSANSRVIIAMPAFATLTVAANSTTTVRVGENWSADELAGYKKLSIGSIQNTHGSATVTNKGVVWSRQN